LVAAASLPNRIECCRFRPFPFPNKKKFTMKEFLIGIFVAASLFATSSAMAQQVPNAVGAIGGALLGGLLGNQVGGGSCRTVATDLRNGDRVRVTSAGLELLARG